MPGEDVLSRKRDAEPAPPGGPASFDLRAGGWLWNGFGLDSLNAWLLMGMLYAPVLIVQISQEIRGDLLAPLSWNPWFRAALCAVAGGMLLALAKTSGGAFIYIQF